MNPPFTYAALNAIDGTIHPSFLHIHNTSLARFFKRYLLQDALSVFDFDLPSWWDADYFRYSLIGFGFVTVFKTDKFGIIPQQCGLSGFNVFYRPTQCTIANPLIGAKILNIGKNCELIKMQPDYSGVASLVDYYGDLMALTWEGITTNILNSKLAYIGYADGKEQAETFKKLYDKIASGEPAVIVKKKSSTLSDSDKFQFFTQNLGQNYIAGDMLDSLRSIQAAFRAEIGIPDLNIQKKERLITAEATKTDIYTRAKSMLWLEEIQNSIERVVKMFPELDGKLAVEFRFKGDDENAGNLDSAGTMAV